MFDSTPLTSRHTTREAMDAAYDAGAAMARLNRTGTAVQAARAAGYAETSVTFKQFCAGYLDTQDRR
jgi:hypothetical protein